MPGNDVIIAKIAGLKELMEEKFRRIEEYHAAINEHLKVLNGQVAKNTEFRTKGVVYFGMIAVSIPLVINYIISII